MNKRNRLIAVGLALGILLSGCQMTSRPVEDTQTPYEDPKDKLLKESETKAAYYEELVCSLQDQLLDVKSALYTSRAEYDALYALYQASNAEKEEAPSSALESTAVDSFRYVKENGGVTVTAYLGSAKEVVLPTHIDGLPVRAVFDRAFSGNVSVTSVTVPEGVESIGWFAFSGCASLKSVSLPSSIQAISYGAFDNCHKDLRVSCNPSSYAYQYALSYGLQIN